MGWIIEIAVNKDLEEVCSKVLELMNYSDWEKEYKRAKKVAETKVKSAQPIYSYGNFHLLLYFEL